MLFWDMDRWGQEGWLGGVGGAGHTEVQVDAGNEGVEEEHEDDDSEDGHTLDQQNGVGDPVLRWAEREGGGVLLGLLLWLVSV